MRDPVHSQGEKVLGDPGSAAVSTMAWPRQPSRGDPSTATGCLCQPHPVMRPTL